MQRIQWIEGSLRCFAFGLISLTPLLGLPAALIALQEFARTRKLAAREWNPARHYLFLGYGLAWAGIGLTATLSGLAGTIVVRSIAGPYL